MKNGGVPKTVRIANGAVAATKEGDRHANEETAERFQKTLKCKVKIYKVSNMQRCPYIHEMKERLLGDQQPIEIAPIKKIPEPPPPPLIMDHIPHHQTVGTVVKLNPDGYGSHTSPTHRRAARAPLMPRDSPHDDLSYLNSHKYPKNAKTSLFIIMSFVYAKLLVVICVAYVISDVVTHNIPLFYYEGFFTYLYGVSILFLLYVFCFLLQESTCCNGGDGEKEAAVKEKKPSKKELAKEKTAKEKEKKKEEKEKKKEEKEKKKKEEKDKEKKGDKKDGAGGKDKKKDKKGDNKSVTYRRNSEGVVDQQVVDASMIPVPVAEIAASHPNVPVPQEPATGGGGGAAVPVQQALPPPQVPPGQPPAVVLAAQQQLMSTQDVESGMQAIVPVTSAAAAKGAAGCKRKRKTTQNDQSHGSFFLRIGAIAFGLGTMIYSGLEFGSWFEIPFTSQCYMILRGVNPALQMVFTFMQMYFIFMNSRLNIHRFKVIARFGLMHVVATNVCVWIRTLVLEYLKEITVYHKRMNDTYTERIRGHTLRNANTILGSHRPIPDYLHPTAESTELGAVLPTALYGLRDIVASTARTLRNYVSTTPTAPTTTTRRPYYHHLTTPSTTPATLWRSFRASPSPPAYNNLIPSFPTTTTTTTTSTALPTTTLQTTTITHGGGRLWAALTSTLTPPSTSTATTVASTTTPTATSTTTTTAVPPLVATSQRNFFANYPGPASLNRFDTNTATNVFDEATTTLQTINGSELLDNILPQSLFGFSWNNTNEYPVSNGTVIAASCERINIMGTIVQDSAPYLFPFIIEYSLIGAAVIYVMWKHIGRNPRYISEEDLEHRLEVMLSRRAVAMAHAQQGRLDCIGASKGLFFGLLLLVGSLICLILFFVLIHHPDLGLLAIYLADVSHCALMALSIIAIIVGFIRVQGLKFKVEEQSDLNDILLRVSAFGLFLYATFSVIAGSLEAFTKESNLLVMVTGILSIVQVVLQLLFIADVTRRRVHLPEHDRSKPGRQVVTFLLICNITMWIIYTFEMQKVEANPVQLEFYGFLAWAIVQRITLPLCIFHRFHSAVTLAEIWKTSYKARLE